MIKKYNSDVTDDEIEIINYGLESIYLTFTKLFIILIISIILGITYKMLLILLFYNIIRFTAFGIHASKSIYCLLSSCLFLIGGVYLCEIIHISLFVYAVLCFICLMCVYFYALDCYKLHTTFAHNSPSTPGGMSEYL